MGSPHYMWLLCLSLLVAVAAATQYKVGDSRGWTVPADSNAMIYNQWAERHRFQIGDSLLFVYPPDRDSVLQVTPEAYSNCSTSSYIQRFDDGNTVITFKQAGPHYFISGDENNCRKNEKVVVVVMADRGNRSSSAVTIPPSPPTNASIPLSPPSPSPNASMPLSPPSPPPSPVEATPPAPSAEMLPPAVAPTAEESGPPPPPNGASLNLASFISSAGAFLGSLFFMLL